MRKAITAVLVLSAFGLALVLGCGSSNSSNSLNGSWLATTNANGQATAPASPSGQQPLSITFDITNSPPINTTPGATTTTTTSGTTTSGTTTANTGATGGNVVTISNMNVVSGASCFNTGQLSAFAALGTPGAFTPNAPMLNANGFVNNGTNGTTNGTAGGTTGGTTTTTTTGNNNNVSATAAGIPLTIEAWSGPNQTGSHLVIISLINKNLNSGTGNYFLSAGTNAGNTVGGTGMTNTTNTTSGSTTGTGTTAATCQDSSGPITLIRQSSSAANNSSATPSASPTPSPTTTPTPSPTSTSTPGTNH